MKTAIGTICRAAAEILDGDHNGFLADTDNNAAREMLKLALRLSDRTPITVRQHSGAVERPLLDREDADSSFWNETPVIPPRPETIAKALEAVPPPAAGVIDG